MVGFIKTVAAVVVGTILVTFMSNALPRRFTPANLGNNFGTFVANHAPHFGE